MKLTQIAAKLRKTAADMEALAAKDGDLDFADEVVLPFVANCLTDDNLLRSTKQRPSEIVGKTALVVDRKSEDAAVTALAPITLA